MEYKEEDYLMLSGIQHYAFCKRQWALIHIEQQWEENYKTTSGELMHKKAHNEEAFEKRGNMIIARGLRISSSKLGITGQCDVVEFHKAKQGINLFGYEGVWSILPIEYKNGSPKEGKEDEAQLCIQALCLEEMFQTDISEGHLYYGENRRRTRVAFTPELRKLVEEYCIEMHDLFSRGYTPKVKPTSKCKSCSLSNICIPKLQKNVSVSQYIKKYMKQEIENHI